MKSTENNLDIEALIKQMGDRCAPKPNVYITANLELETSPPDRRKAEAGN